ncbi:MAG: phosphate ABC transporter substrate-binding protein [Coriobacteriales bacterium]|nr:phosphate ABC transporter substrate-binding protein [Coriobacteriales bacterium]
MRRTVALLAAALLLVGGLTGCNAGSGRAANKQLIVAGSTTLLPIAEISAEQYRTRNGGAKVLVSGLGSSAGIEAVAAGTADIGTSSRDLKEEEAGLGLVDTPVAYDGIAVIVNPANPVDGLTSEQLRAIFAGQITDWSQVGGPSKRIQLVNRDEASGTREAFRKIVMDETPFEKHAAVLPGTGQVRDVVSRSESAIGYISLGFVEPRFTSRRVKSLAIDGVTPSDKTVSSGDYPISRTLHFFTKGQPKGLTADFTEFVLSPAIQDRVVVDAGFIPASRQAGAR